MFRFFHLRSWYDTLTDWGLGWRLTPEPLQASPDFSGGLALGGPAGGVGAGQRVIASTD